MSHKALLYAIVFILLSYLTSTLSLVHFSPWTFFAQITLGLAFGGLGFVFLVIFLLRKLRHKITL